MSTPPQRGGAPPPGERPAPKNQAAAQPPNATDDSATRIPERPQGTGADWLYAVVGSRRVEPVHRALTKVLHPYTDPGDHTGDHTLMVQLNAARDRMAATR